MRALPYGRADESLSNPVASPKEVAARAGHASVVTVLDRYGHLLPGTEDRVNDALDVTFNGVVTPSMASIVNLISDENASSRVQSASS